MAARAGPLRSNPVKALLVLFSLVLASPSGAGLVWESETVTIETQGSAETRTTEFRFRNDSDRPVRIRGVRSSCGCTVVKPEKDVYAPGESGVLPVTHKPKTGTMPRRYRLSVLTDEAPSGKHELALVVLGEPRLMVEGRRMLVWEKGEPRVPKEIALRIRPGDALRLTGASAGGDAATVELAGTGSSRVLRVTPKDGATGRLRIRLLSEPALPEADAAFFAVLR